MKSLLPFLGLLLLLEGCASSGRGKVAAPPPWGRLVSSEIDALGIQNWIVVAEASYPVISRRGVRTVVVDAEIPEIVDFVVNDLERSQNVTPSFNTARELYYIDNDRAPGIDQFRKELKTALHGHEVRQLDHRSLSLLTHSESSKFVVLVLKSKTSLPYTNVFIELDSGYWDRDSEDEMRDSIRAAQEEAARKQQEIDEAKAGRN